MAGSGGSFIITESEVASGRMCLSCPRIIKYSISFHSICVISYSLKLHTRNWREVGCRKSRERKRREQAISRSEVSWKLNVPAEYRVEETIVRESNHHETKLDKIWKTSEFQRTKKSRIFKTYKIFLHRKVLLIHDFLGLPTLVKIRPPLSASKQLRKRGLSCWLAERGRAYFSHRR